MKTCFWTSLNEWISAAMDSGQLNCMTILIFGISSAGFPTNSFDSSAGSSFGKCWLKIRSTAPSSCIPWVNMISPLPNPRIKPAPVGRTLSLKLA